ncbi:MULTISPECIES: HesB/YadR/YfhF family protein [Paraliobacillus]|uniref:HesB/YadR/YfhF family protein n=1 Tax=Paraliobacillus TaxID=200903 RepID=UPI000DD340C5|nr:MULTISPECIES: HesB/YadR/YfhF family protein [Paraliobacillus]
MEISITQPAVKWFINEMELETGDTIRFFARYGGHGGIHKGFSLGISTNAEANNPIMQIEEQGITFFVEKSDAWYFDNMNFHIKYSRKLDEVDFLIE